MLFEPVWISSLNHLAEFETIYHNTSWLRRLGGAYEIPAGFPYLVLLKGHSLWERRFPIILFCQGQMRIKNHEMDFWAMDWAVSQNSDFQQFDLITEWDFTLAGEEIVAVQPHPYQSPLIPGYSIPFTRILTTHKDKLLSDFLVCVGGEGLLLGKIRKQSEELADALQTLNH